MSVKFIFPQSICVLYTIKSLVIYDKLQQQIFEQLSCLLLTYHEHVHGVIFAIDETPQLRSVFLLQYKQASSLNHRSMIS